MGYSNIVNQSRGGLGQTSTGPGPRQFSFLDPSEIVNWYRKLRPKSKLERPERQAPAPVRPMSKTTPPQNMAGPPLSELQARQHGLLSGNIIPLGMQGSPVLSQLAPMQMERTAFMGSQSNLPFMQGFTGASKQNSPALAGKLAGGYSGAPPKELPSPQGIGQPQAGPPMSPFGADYLGPTAYRPGYFQAREAAMADTDPSVQSEARRLAQQYWGS